MSSQVFHTASDDQTEVRIRVYQGDQREARKNFLLGEFVLDGLPIGPRGTAKVRVTFAIDADGIVNITAEDVDGSNSRGIRVEASSSLSGAQVEELVFDDEPEHLLPGEDGSLIPALDNDDFALETEELEVDETEELEVDEDDDDLNLDEDENEHLG
jgi:molecular chaperone DnaK